MLKNIRFNKNNKLFSVLMLFLLIMAFFVSNYVVYAESINSAGVERYEIERPLLLDKNDIGRTDKKLIPSRKIKLLNFDAELVAEYIEFKNELREYVGYVIRDAHSGHIYDYSNKGKLFEGLLAKSKLTYQDVYKGKVYFVNPFEIYVELNNGKIIDLMPESGIYSQEISKNQLEESFYERQVKFGKPIQPNLKYFKTSKASLMNVSSFIPSITSDFSNLKITDSKGRRVYPHDHCSPTAATTIMTYFRYLGKSSLLASYSDSDVFAKFYIAMDTNGGVSGSKDSGTVRSKIAPSYSKVGRELGAKPTESVKLRGTSSQTMINALDEGKILHVSVSKLGTIKGGHSIVVVSHSNSCFEVADGWNPYFRNIEYSDMAVEQVVAIKY